ncbi:MAG TPA: type II toxin-antitoxin system HicB family antitoxin, partial [Luteibacter sp.]|nr:type II toxin-antitoxin system HicB family antitoxin [Luteibacter sp.]
MNNLMIIDGYRAVIQYDPEIELFRGEFVGLHGGADFYAGDVKGLRKEGTRSLRTFLDTCKENGIEPVRNFSGKFNARIDPALHARAVEAAAALGVSLNQFVERAITH